MNMHEDMNVQWLQVCLICWQESSIPMNKPLCTHLLDSPVA